MKHRMLLVTAVLLFLSAPIFAQRGAVCDDCRYEACQIFINGHYMNTFCPECWHPEAGACYCIIEGGGPYGTGQCEPVFGGCIVDGDTNGCEGTLGPELEKKLGAEDSVYIQVNAKCQQDKKLMGKFRALQRDAIEHGRKFTIDTGGKERFLATFKGKGVAECRTDEHTVRWQDEKGPFTIDYATMPEKYKLLPECAK